MRSMYNDMSSPKNAGASLLPRARRIGVIGGTTIEDTARPFCRKLGEKLAEYPNVTVVTGGRKGQRAQDQPEGFKPSAIWYTVEGVLKALDRMEPKPDIEDKLETLIPEEPEETDSDRLIFQEGRIKKIREPTIQARRFALVASVDVIVSISGGSGTQQMLDLALALKCPTLPIPLFEGTSKCYWENHQEWIKKQFPLTDVSWEQFESKDEDAMHKAADLVAKTLYARFLPTCMVLMPFKRCFDALYQRIKKTLQSKGFQAVRTDQEKLLGEIVQSIHTGLRYCDCALAVLTGLNANVMYELGLAHARNKPVILLAEKGSMLPFDIRNQEVIFYEMAGSKLEEDLASALAEVARRSFSPTPQ